MKKSPINPHAMKMENRDRKIKFDRARSGRGGGRFMETPRNPM